MKKIFLTLIMAGLMISTYAQTADTAKAKLKSPEERATSVAKQMGKNLGISEDQKTKVHAAAFKETTAVNAAKGKTPEDKVAVKAARDAFMAELKTILTSEQFTKWDEFKKAQKAQKKPETGEKK